MIRNKIGSYAKKMLHFLLPKYPNNIQQSIEARINRIDTKNRNLYAYQHHSTSTSINRNKLRSYPNIISLSYTKSTLITFNRI